MDLVREDEPTLNPFPQYKRVRGSAPVFHDAQSGAGTSSGTPTPSGPFLNVGRSLQTSAVTIHSSPGGWNRIHLIVSDVAAEVDKLRVDGVTFRNDIVTGPGGQQIMPEDPYGNDIELFQPAADK